MKTTLLSAASLAFASSLFCRIFALEQTMIPFYIPFSCAIWGLMYHIFFLIIFSFWTGVVCSTVPHPEAVPSLCSPPLPRAEPLPVLLHAEMGDLGHTQHSKDAHGFIQ